MAKNFKYIVGYGKNGSEHQLTSWSETCHYIKFLIDNGWANITVRKA
jgi:hypothetical protein